MPITHELRRLPTGHQYVYMVTSGQATGEEAMALRAVVGPGAPHEGKPIVSIIVPGASFSPEARRGLASIGEGSNATEFPKVAIVVSSTALRVTLGFVLRFSKATFVKFFATEAEAMTWMTHELQDAPVT